MKDGGVAEGGGMQKRPTVTLEMAQDGGEEEEEEEEGFGTCLSSQLELGFRRSTDLEPPGA